MSRGFDKERRTGLACIVTLAMIGAAFVAFDRYLRQDVAWWLLGAALLLSIAWQRSILLEGTACDGAAGPAGWPRRILGASLAIAGALLWYRSSTGLTLDWRVNFDGAWIGWFGGAVLLSVGLDLAWARWSSPATASRRWKIAATAAALVLLGAAVRLGTFYFFPAPYHVTQVEELQVGAMAAEALAGSRIRWEYLSQAWLGALGFTLGGHSLMAIRMPSTVISFLKLVPFFFWLRFAVGNTGAVVGGALLALSGWDSTFARVATNHNVFIVASAFALLNGPARRGRPSAYVWLGLFSGYVMFEYVLYRPLAAFALAGAVLVSLRDRHSHWLARLARPLITAALFLAMGWPLYTYITTNGRTSEFFDGYGRATANRSYYNPDDPWTVSLSKRLDRAQLATGLFYFRGADSPVSNPKAEPLADHFTGALLLLGVGYCLAHPFRRLFGLTLAAGALTLGSALVLTGNFDFVRAGSAVGYVYALAGIGAASLATALRGLTQRWGSRLAALLLTLGVLYAAVVNGSYLWYFVNAPEIRRAQFRDFAYLSWWIAHNVPDAQRAVVAAPSFTYVMGINDAAWMRGLQKRGAAFWDIQSALRDWERHPEATVLMIYAAGSSPDLQAYLAWLLPDVPLQLVPGPVGPDKSLLFAATRTPSANLSQRLARWGCQPVKIHVEFIGDGGAVLDSVDGSAGLIDPTLWPGIIQAALQRVQPQARLAKVRFTSEFEVKQAGQYVFPLEVYPGSGTVMVDGRAVAYPPSTAVDLAPGRHHLEVLSQYDPNANWPSHRLYWLGPDTGGKRELLPFYRLAPENCSGGD